MKQHVQKSLQSVNSYFTVQQIVLNMNRQFNVSTTILPKTVWYIYFQFCFGRIWPLINTVSSTASQMTVPLCRRARTPSSPQTQLPLHQTSLKIAHIRLCLPLLTLLSLSSGLPPSLLPPPPQTAPYHPTRPTTANIAASSPSLTSAPSETAHYLCRHVFCMGTYIFWSTAVYLYLLKEQVDWAIVTSTPTLLR